VNAYYNEVFAIVSGGLEAVKHWYPKLQSPEVSSAGKSRSIADYRRRRKNSSFGRANTFAPLFTVSVLKALPLLFILDLVGAVHPSVL